ncbi:hypothetical protein J437_LFUL012693 [Ladona fulva]|uniref:Uncharacterized protein n=1 Tax=Ladona fulva TaxID=123851 RepID=A0A8K0JZH4_LADFU|nr:hypothetical protein J437_LFUL012693 [Ladona fulva]
MQTALHVAAAGGHMACVHLLVQAGAQLDATDRDHSTPLMLAVRAGHNDVVAYLVRAGACVTLKGSEGMTALHLACKSGNLESAQELIAAGSPISSNQYARGSGKQLSPGPLPQPRSFIDSQDDGGWTPLVWGCEHRHMDVVRFLLSKRADPLVRDTEQNIALHWSAFSGSLEVSELLLNHGCWVNCANAHGDTPLHVAARQNNYEVVVLLLARGARTDLRNREGETPLDCCFPPGESAPAELDDSQLTDTARAIQLNVQLRALVESPLQPTPRILTNDISRGREVNPVQCVNEVDDPNSEEGAQGPPRDFTYISENCVTSDIRINRSIASLHSCRCGDIEDKWMNGEKIESKSGWGCCSGGSGEVVEGEGGSLEDRGCLCANSSVRCWYDEEGKLVPEFNFADPPMIFECNQACLCNRVTCHNRVVQHGLTARMQLFKTPNKGWGVRTLRMIPKGSYVCEISENCKVFIRNVWCEDDQNSSESLMMHSYILEYDGETYCIDARRYGNVARFINHMCAPNLQPVKVFVEHQDPHFPRIAFFANRDILPDEELGFDYGEKFWIIKCKSFTCTCRAENCRYSETTIGHTLELYRARLAMEEETSTSCLRLGATAASILQKQQNSSSAFVQVNS